MKQLTIQNLITKRDEASLDAYLRDISRIPLLSIQEEIDLATKAQKGDIEAANKLAEGNLRFVVSVAKQYQYLGVSLPDLIATGNLGLLKAAQKFDPTRGFKFISYAVWWIRQQINSSVNEHLKAIRLPANCEAAIGEYNKAYEILQQKLKREPSIEEVIEYIPTMLDEATQKTGKVRKSKLDNKTNRIELITTSYKPVSLDSPTQSDSELTLLDTLAHPEALSEVVVLDRTMQKERLNNVLKTLTPLEMKVLTLRFGLDGEGQRSYDEIGFLVELTGERIRQIQHKALRKLKRHKGIQEIFSDFINS